MTLDRVLDLVDELNRTKLIAVGSGSPAFPTTQVDAPGVAFDDAVTAIWTWYDEEFRHDRLFLTARADSAQKAVLRDFSALLDGQRHVKQHAGFNRTVEAMAWRTETSTTGDEPSDAELLQALLSELVTVLAALASVAETVGRDVAGRKAWSGHEARTPESEVRAVLADIGRDALPQQRIDTIVRRFGGHPKLKYAQTPRDRTRIAAVVAIEMNLSPLTVSHSEILDEFGLIGDPRGIALLLVAHGVQEAGFTGTRLLPALRRAWGGIHSNSALKPGN